MKNETQVTGQRLSVTFAIKLPGLGMLSENDERFAASAAAASVRIGLEDLDGQIVLTAGDSVVIEDDIVYLAWRLCLGAVPALRSGERYEAKLYNGSGEVVFEPMGDHTRLTVSGTPGGIYPSQQLADELISCVRRFARALERLGAGDAQVEAAAAALVDRIVELEVG